MLSNCFCSTKTLVHKAIVKPSSHPECVLRVADLARNDIFGFLQGCTLDFLEAVSFKATTATTGFIFVHAIFCPKCQCSLFLELTPTLWQMPRDFTNISEDWADFCQCQEFWCLFLTFIFQEKNSLNYIPKLWKWQNLRKATGNICDCLWHLSKRG